MSATLPKITVAFTTLATSFIERSERGIAIVIVREDADDPITASIQEVDLTTDLTGWSNANAAKIGDMLTIGPAKVVVVTIDVSADLSDATDLIEGAYPSGRVTVASETAADYTALSNWAKTLKTYHALVFDATSPDSRYVENVADQNIVFSSDWDADRIGQGSLVRTSDTTEELLPMLCAILSKANVNGASSTVLTALASCTDVSSPDSVVDAGKIIIYNDWKGSDRVVRLGTAVNSLVTFDVSANNGDQIEDMRYIEVSEAADMIRADIKSVFRDTYVGVRKNSVDNQMQLIAAIKNYYASLMDEEILNSASENTVEIDVDAQRNAWVTQDPDAADWDDDTVRSKPYKRKVFLKSSIQILQSMQDLDMTISL